MNSPTPAKYLQELTRHLLSNDSNKISLLTELLKKVKSDDKKILVFGNGGSAAIASHFTVDSIKSAGINCINIHDPSVLTCFANDYGYENSLAKFIEFFAKPGDLTILISSSGGSQNMINAALTAKEMNLSLVTFTGFKENNPLKQFGKINFWVDSTQYNYIENTHQTWLLCALDMIVY